MAETTPNATTEQEQHSSGSTGTTARRLACVIEARERRDWTQRQLGAEMGVSQAQIHRWETGEREPDRPTRARLCLVLGISKGRLERELDSLFGAG